MDLKSISFQKKTVGFGSMFRLIKNDYFTLSEGDVINIKTNREFKRIPLLNRDMERLFDIALENFLNKSVNLNFTFLIELDPLN